MLSLKQSLKYTSSKSNEFLRSDFLQSSFKVCENYSHPFPSYSQCCICLHKFSRVNQIVLVGYMAHKFKGAIIVQLSYDQRLQIANQTFSFLPFSVKFSRLLL